jgi:hypothetical protein
VGRVLGVLAGVVFGAIAGLALALTATPALIGNLGRDEGAAMGIYFLMMFGAPVVCAVLGGVVMGRTHD